MRKLSLLLMAVLLAGSGLLAQDEYVNAVMADSPVAYYRFEEAAGAEVTVDSSGNGHDSVQIVNTDLGVAGPVGNTAFFPGNGSIVVDLQFNMADPDGPEADDNDFTLEAYVQPTVIAVPNSILAQKDGSLSPGRTNLLLTNTAEAFFGAFIGGGATTSTVGAQAGAWYHVVLTYEGSAADGETTMRFYVNGQEAGSGTRRAEAANGNWVIGSHKNQTMQWFTGHIDEVAFYDYRLDDPDGDGDTSDSRVPAHFDALPSTPCGSLGLTCKFTEAGDLQALIDPVPELCSCSALEVYLDDELVSSGELPQDGVIAIPLPDPCEPQSEHVVKVVCAPDGGQETCTFICPGGEDAYVDTVMADGPVAYYRFEEETGAEITADSSGNGHDSVQIVNAELGVAGLVGNAALFPGDASIVVDLQLDMADPEGDGPDAGDNDFTLEAFVLPTVVAPANSILAQKDGTGLGRTNVLVTETEGAMLGVYIGGATTPSTVSAQEGAWQHVVVTYEGGAAEGETTMRFYVNGQYAGSGTRRAESANGNWVIGSHKNQGQQYFIGLIDEVAFYDYRLDDPDGDGDIADTRIPAHFAAARGVEPPCSLLNPMCSVTEDDLVQVTFDAVPDGCACATVDVRIDDGEVQTLPLTGDPILLDLPAACEPETEHIVTVVCNGMGSGETCSFICPSPEPCSQLNPACTVNEETSLIEVTITPGPVDCVCAALDILVDDVQVGSIAMPQDGMFTVALPDPCEPGSDHTLTIVCSPDGASESCTFTCPGAVFMRGDVNGEGKVDLADAIFTLSYLFLPEEPDPKCMDTADANDDGKIDLSDAIKILGHLFAEEGPLPDPFGECGPDLTDDDLDCGEYTSCQT